MNKKQLLRAVFYLLSWFVIATIEKAQADTTISAPVIPLTQMEQAVRVNELKWVFPPAAIATSPKDLVFQTINKVQKSEPYFRRPVPLDQIQELQRNLEKATGRPWSPQRVASVVDYSHAMLRENSQDYPKSFNELIDRDSKVDRKAFHGQVAEFREGRARDMSLTKDKQSATFDLTEEKVRPRSAQLKVFRDPSRGLRELQEDFQFLPKRARHGILPYDDIPTLVRRGDLRTSRVLASGDRVYRSTSGPAVTVLPSKAIGSAEDSQRYSQMGKQGLSELDSASKTRNTLGKGWLALGLAGSGLLAWDAYQESATAWQMWNDPIEGHTWLPYRQAILASGEWAGSGALGFGSAANLALKWELLGDSRLTRFGLRAGNKFPLIASGVDAWSAGSAYYDYSMGRISQREFGKRAIGPSISLVITAGGAALGTAMGNPIAGGKLGAIAAIPVRTAAEWWYCDSYYGKFDEEQRAAVDRAVDKLYGVTTE